MSRIINIFVYRRLSLLLQDHHFLFAHIIWQQCFERGQIPWSHQMWRNTGVFTSNINDKWSSLIKLRYSDKSPPDQLPSSWGWNIPTWGPTSIPSTSLLHSVGKFYFPLISDSQQNFVQKTDFTSRPATNSGLVVAGVWSVFNIWGAKLGVKLYIVLNYIS